MPSAQTLRFFLYALFIAYVTSRLTYVTAHLSPDRPFSMDQVLYVVVVGFLSAACFVAIELAVAVDHPARYVFACSGVSGSLLIFFTIATLMSVKPLTCNASSVTLIGHTKVDFEATRLEHDFGSEIRIWRSDAYHDTHSLNLTGFRNIENQFSDDVRPFLAHFMSTYDLLNNSYLTDTADWVVVVEGNARPLPDFHKKLTSVVCRYPDRDIIWLQGPAVLRWTISGGIVDGTVGMVYKRHSIPKLLQWLDLDGEAIAYGRKEHPEGSDNEKGWQIVALPHVISDACWIEKFKCAVAPLVVESTT